MNRLGAGVCFFLLLLSMATVSCKQETFGGARKEVDSRKAPPLFSKAGSDSFLKEAEASLEELKKKTDEVEDGLRRTARRAFARRELAEVREKLESMEADLEKLKGSDREASEEVKADISRKEDELEILLNRAASDMG